MSYRDAHLFKTQEMRVTSFTSRHCSVKTSVVRQTTLKISNQLVCQIDSRSFLVISITYNVHPISVSNGELSHTQRVLLTLNCHERTYDLVHNIGSLGAWLVEITIINIILEILFDVQRAL